MKRLLLSLVSVLLIGSAFAQSSGKIKWLSIEEAEKLNKKEPRKIIMDFYTSWCGWCKRMDANTFNNPKIAEYINKHYYAVKVNAEMRDTIVFNGRTFINPAPAGKRGTHQIASYAAQNGRVGYPTIVYLDEKLRLIQAIPNYMTPQQIEPILVYFGESFYTKKEYQKFLSEDFKTVF